MKVKTVLVILIQHGLLSKMVEMKSLSGFKGVAKEFLASTSQRMKLVEVFIEFSRMQVSSKEDLWEISLLSYTNYIADPLN